MPTKEELRSFLVQRGVKFMEAPVQYGTKFECSTGEKFVHYDKRGKVVVGGRTTELGQAVKAWCDDGFTPSDPDSAPAPEARRDRINNDVFVVYGHDTAAREQLELLLRRLGMNPIVLANLSPEGDTIIEKLERYLGAHSNVGFACVLLTPDDEGHRAGASEEKKYRARQNVILELGMVLSRLGRKRVAILIKQSVETPSDIAGLIYIGFTEHVREVASDLFRALKGNGYEPREDGLA
jgi:predicted nucleotide-binding protein